MSSRQSNSHVKTDRRKSFVAHVKSKKATLLDNGGHAERSGTTLR